MNKIEISSFQGWLANDRNQWPKGGFWNSKNIEFRKNSAYIELSKWVTDAFSLPWGSWAPVALAYWKNGGTVTTDIVAFTTDGKIIDSTGVESTVTNGSIVNIIEANGIKYLIGQKHLYSFTNVTTTTLLETFTNTVTTRPAIVFWGDLIIWDWTQVLRYNFDTTLVEFSAWTSTTVIWNLDGTVQALTTVGSSVYVWCNNWVNTNLYLWDGISGDWSQKITYQDMPVRNVAILGNQHYWWSNKWDSSIRKVNIWEGYAIQTVAKSDYPKYPITTQYDDDRNRLAITDDATVNTNAIETIADIVYLPWIGSIYWFGKYFPWQNPSIAREYTFTGTYVYCMTSGSTTASGYDVSWVLAFGCLDSSTYKIKLINLGADGLSGLGITYQSSGEIESYEYNAPSFAVGESNKKMLVSWNLPHSSTSIEIYYKIDRWSYTLAKTIDSTTYWTGYKMTEIPIKEKWSTMQFKFKLITSNSSYTPQLYLWMINESETAWQNL